MSTGIIAGVFTFVTRCARCRISWIVGEFVDADAGGLPVANLAAIAVTRIGPGAPRAYAQTIWRAGGNLRDIPVAICSRDGLRVFQRVG